MRHPLASFALFAAVNAALFIGILVVGAQLVGINLLGSLYHGWGLL